MRLLPIIAALSVLSTAAFGQNMDNSNMRSNMNGGMENNQTTGMGIRHKMTRHEKMMHKKMIKKKMMRNL
ncbi:hypothetical protein [Rhodoplanes sp. Z2-YC6860]|uniref:hypothetical protein n=1 Tax=Rhodoplanes sp. Z2-YC6860 TaxID=674703 RepID=UPI0012ECCA09|nr:hypothetical protein [Rhodoplanes sp. Z2-YC6860]